MADGSKTNSVKNHQSIEPHKMRIQLLSLLPLISSALAVVNPMFTKKTVGLPTLPTTTTVPTAKTDISKTSRETSTSIPKVNSSISSTNAPLVTLNEKLTEQISQMNTIINHLDENRLAMKRLIEMMSHFLDDQNRKRISETTKTPKPESHHFFKMNHSVTVDDQSKKTTFGVNQTPSDNHTLYVSFGSDADPDRYPWAVAIRGNDKDRCGGTLIDDQHVLTAAHCIGTRTTEIFVGSHLYKEGEEVKPSFYCVHFAYSSSTYYRNDLAVIRLAKPVSVRPPRRVSTIEICNRSQTVNLVVPTNQANLWMIGWGLKSNEIEPDELQEAQVTLADRSMCQGSSRYTDMCVQSRSSRSPVGACTGDSGSGLFHQTIATNKWCLLGVTSSANTHFCEQTQYTTYVHAASQDYDMWFRDVLDRKYTFDDLQRLERCKPRTWGQEFCRWYAC